MQSIKNKVVVITGASRGIGAAIARHFAHEQTKLVLCGRDQKALNEVKQYISDNNTECITISGDIRTHSGIAKIVSESIKFFNTIDIFINNAGVGFKGDINSTSEEDFDKIIETNLKSVFLQLQRTDTYNEKTGRGTYHQYFFISR